MLRGWGYQGFPWTPASVLNSTGPGCPQQHPQMPRVGPGWAEVRGGEWGCDPACSLAGPRVSMAGPHAERSHCLHQLVPLTNGRPGRPSPLEAGTPAPGLPRPTSS